MATLQTRFPALTVIGEEEVSCSMHAVLVSASLDSDPSGGMIRFRGAGDKAKSRSPQLQLSPHVLVPYEMRDELRRQGGKLEFERRGGQNVVAHSVPQKQLINYS